MSADWLGHRDVAVAIHKPLVRGEGYVPILEVLRRIGKEQGEDVRWLDTSSAQRVVRIRARSGNGAHTIAQALMDVHADLIGPRRPAEELVFGQLQEALQAHALSLADVDPMNPATEAVAVIKEVVRRTGATQERLLDLILREQMATAALA